MNKPLFFRKPFKYVYFHATLCIILINFIIYFLCNFNSTLKVYLAMNVYYVVVGKMYWQFLTYMFVHQGISHILVNMLGLFFFGIGVERAIGSKEFILIRSQWRSLCSFICVCCVLSAINDFYMGYITSSSSNSCTHLCPYRSFQRFCRHLERGTFYTSVWIFICCALFYYQNGCKSY